MNELSKLISSVILLGAGFLAASLVGPPEVIERLSHYLRPTGPSDAAGLRPLASNSAPIGAESWPALPSASGPSVPPTNQVASVAAMVPPGSWPAETPAAPATPHSATSNSPWGGADAASFATPPSSDDWFTGASLNPPGVTQAATPAAEPSHDSFTAMRPLTPVPRSGVTEPAESPAAVAPAVAAPAETAPAAMAPAEWPELRAPLPPSAEAPFADFGAPPAFGQEVTAAKPALNSKPALNESPYGERPRYDATSSHFDSGANPLRYDASQRQSFEPIERQPVANSYVQHIVTDGDTLPALAERYLGDASRAAELFELNNDRLEHPDVLPIGMVLRAPEGGLARKPTPVAGVSYPRLERPGDFATVSASEAYLPPLAAAPRRPLTPVGATDDRPLSREQELGPVDAVYQQEIAWDANRW
ncbi:LysM peptidoglycan-binding domain-containing protein [Botrimarina colliarenosi]|uniref:LysM peptidoglycan-binding domain-containing protein n=1 Tax=Botrimarina colliarenosi TaxID=2528001 RepID=UPI0011B3C3BD|nr:LysM peptidoglycan-binding domain-containing protein [Botrimarina colliarenosi]